MMYNGRKYLAYVHVLYLMHTCMYSTHLIACSSLQCHPVPSCQLATRTLSTLPTSTRLMGHTPLGHLELHCSTVQHAPCTCFRPSSAAQMKTKKHGTPFQHRTRQGTSILAGGCASSEQDMAVIQREAEVHRFSSYMEEAKTASCPSSLESLTALLAEDEPNMHQTHNAGNAMPLFATYGYLPNAQLSFTP